MNENIEKKAPDTEGDLSVCDDVEKNDAFTSIDIGASDYHSTGTHNHNLLVISTMAIIA